VLLSSDSQPHASSSSKIGVTPIGISNVAVT
jgi:hypothetical protein